MAKEKDKNVNTWAMLCHLTALSLYIGVPLGHIIVPLIIWLIKKDEFKFVDEQGKESLNFQISMTIYAIVASFMILIVIGIIFIAGLVIAHIALTIVAAVKANQGEGYHYPFTIRFIK